MKSTKKISKMWLIIMIMLSTLIMMPLTVVGVTETKTESEIATEVETNPEEQPTIKFERKGGEVIQQSEDFKEEYNENGYGTIKVTANAKGDNKIEYVYYVWDWQINKNQKFKEAKWPIPEAELSLDIPVPQGESGLRIACFAG